mmetsp:Transcript_6223/g.22460  ORF Transcript_6223/g.22460 Transcript_6223/m.22460 type:complete len:236 (-) Transcript_6223:1546-2253(-)
MLDNAGFACNNQRRGVTPLVTLMNFSGHINRKSGNSCDLRSLVWIMATPLTVCEPMTAKFAMRTIFGDDSSMILIEARRALSCGHISRTCAKKRWLISKMICMCLGRSSAIMGTDHFSNASGNIVWFVYAKTFCVISHAASQDNHSPSMSNRMSSGIAIAGCVSFNCIATLSGMSFIRVPLRPMLFLNLRKMSCNVALTKKNCCFKRKRLPSSVSSFGYNTDVMLSQRSLASTAP